MTQTLEAVMRRFCLLLSGAVALSACGGGGGNGGTGPTANTITVNAGNNQVGAAGSALAESLAVIVRDQAGDPLAGATVTFAVTGGGGSVSPASRQTDASGIAKTRRTLGPNAGTQTTSATTGTLPPAPFSAVAQINGAVNIANSTPAGLTDTVGATEAESLAVLVTNQNATPVQGITVTWAPSGSVSATSVPTTAAGLSKVRFTYGNTAGNQTATATVTGLVGSPVTITLNATAGTAVTIAKTAGDNGAAAPNGQVTYTVQSRDSRGNAKGGVTIDWAVATGGGSIDPPQNTTAGNGNASATRTLGAGTGAQTATATAAGLPTSPTVTFTTTAATVTTVQVANNSFTPMAVTIAAGGAVNWEWQGTTAAHNVTFANTPGRPADITDRNQGSESRAFNTAGTFNYSCTNHGGMNGTVTVNP